MVFTLVIVGRPNVGKSTLFNRLAGRRLALVDDSPGVTRDRREGRARLGDLSFTIVDTAGLEEGDAESLIGRMRAQTEEALASADAALLMIDARAGLTPLDEHFAEWLRQKEVPAVVVANKCEGRSGEAGRIEAYALGLGTPIPVSAEHGEGMADLFAALAPLIDAYESAAKRSGEREGAEVSAGEEGASPLDLEIAAIKEGDMNYAFGDSFAPGARPLRLAITGRPNVGKSTLINRLIGEERLVTGPEAGLTRDSIAVDWQWEGRALRLFDTAGLRKRAKIEARVERLAVGDTLRAIRFAEVVVVLLDASEGFERQDVRIANRVLDEGRGLVLGANKWDLVADKRAAARRLRERAERALPHAAGLEIIPISALEGSGLKRLMETVFRTYEMWNSRVQTASLNAWLEEAVERHPPPLHQGRRLKIRYITQVKTRPPTFVLFVSRPREFPGNYLRYLENELRMAFDLPATPIRLLLRQGKNPYRSRRR